MIREITKEDIPYIFELLKISWVHTYEPIGIDKNSILLMFKDKDGWISNFEFFLNSKDAEAYVYEKEGTLEGVIFGRDSVIQALYIHPDFQNKGLGKKLLHKFIGNKKEVTLHVLDINKKSQLFYEKNGFDSTGECKYFFIENKKYKDLEYVLKNN